MQATQLQERVASNRAHTRALLERRLRIANREQGRHAAKILTGRRRIRYVKLALVAVTLTAATLWLCMTILGLEVRRSVTPSRGGAPSAAVAQLPKSSPAEEATPAAIDLPGDRELSILRFDDQLTLTKPVSQH